MNKHLKSTLSALGAAAALSLVGASSYLGWLALRMPTDMARYAWQQHATYQDTWKGDAWQSAQGVIWFALDSWQGELRLNTAFTSGGGLLLDQGVADAMLNAPQPGLLRHISRRCYPSGEQEDTAYALQATVPVDLKTLQSEVFFNKTFTGESQAEKLQWWYFTYGGSTALRTPAFLLPGVSSYANARDRTQDLARVFPVWAIECGKSASASLEDLKDVLPPVDVQSILSALRHPESAPTTLELRGSGLPAGKLKVVTPEPARIKWGQSKLLVTIELPADQIPAAFKALENMLPSGLHPHFGTMNSQGTNSTGSREFMVKNGNILLVYSISSEKNEVSFLVTVDSSRDNEAVTAK